MRLYIETRVRTPMDVLWDRTQVPDQHERWDLRFTEIDFLPCPAGEPQAFRYVKRLLPGLPIAGTGVTIGERKRADGSCTSALRFASPHPLSPIAEGAGYWRYVPDGRAGIRFLTGYDYRPRWGLFGRVADRHVIRPLMGWATAWSFDRLRLWCERGLSPERLLANALVELAARVAVASAVAGIAPAWTVAAVAAVLAVPPLPTTPAARRCVRTPPDRAASATPSTMHRLTMREFA